MKCELADKKKMKDFIEMSITQSQNTDSIVHVSVVADDIYTAMDGINYDDAIQVDGGYDVWGADWRLAITLR